MGEYADYCTEDGLAAMLYDEEYWDEICNDPMDGVYIRYKKPSATKVFKNFRAPKELE